MFVLKLPLDNYCDSWCFVGSRVTCNPAPMDTDCDILCLTEDEWDQDRFVDYLQDEEWEEGGSGTQIDYFESWKKTIDETPYNIILTHSPKWYDTFIRATLACKKKNLLKKKDRISTFNHIFRKHKKEMEKPKGLVDTLTMYQSSLQAQQVNNANTFNSQLQTSQMQGWWTSYNGDGSLGVWTGTMGGGTNGS